ncbi:MAG: hypothetical protein ACRCTY_09850, partial [Candidatus Adiutrix sp.]
MHALKSAFLLESLSRLAKQKKIILIVDDIQWLDGASITLIHNILFELGTDKLLVIAAYRTDYESEIKRLIVPLAMRGTLEHIDLKRFSFDETKEMVSQLHPPTSSDPVMIEQIYRDTEGIALFIIELLYILKNKGDISCLSSKATNIIKSRLLELSEGQLKILKTISLFSGHATMNEIKIINNMPDLEIFEFIEQLIHKHLITETSAQGDISYSFTHQQIRDFTYNDQSLGKKRLLHKKIASYYETHYANSQNMNLYPKLIYHFNKSCDQFKTYYYKIQYLERLFYLYNEIYPNRLEEPGWERVGNDVIPDKEELTTLALEIEAFKDIEPDLKMQIHFVLGRYYIHACDYRRGLASINKSLKLAHQLKDQTYILNNYKQFVYYGLQVANFEMVAKYLTAAEIIINQNQRNKIELAWHSRILGWYTINMHEIAHGQQILLKTIESLLDDPSIPSMNLAVCYSYLGNSYMLLGDLKTAYNYFNQAIKVCDKKFLTNGLAIFYSEASYALYQLGDYDQAKNYNNLAIASFEITNTTWGRINAEINKALIESKVGSPEKAHEYLKAARLTGIKLNNP